MFMHFVQQVSGKIIDLYTQVSLLVTEQLLPNVKNLRAISIQAYQDAANLVAKIVLNIRVWLVNLTIQVQLIKAGLINVQAKVILLGSQLLTTVLQINQLVHQALLQIKDKLVAFTKSAQSRLKEIGLALIHTAHPLIQIGTKLQDLVNPLLQRVVQAFKKGN